MMNFIHKILAPVATKLQRIPLPVRSLLYRVGTALLPLLVFYKVTSEESLPLILEVFAWVLGIGSNAVAASNTPRVREK